ncbi:histidinol-phosphatase HisJ [Halalkalibacterium ligniniphilum]|uniref:histidinol-phosphatase HisJ n=1 Tax=Halalkalibacterium ligniniphilum TaxID=1134413 RepID=UPI000349A2A6|nr:histidinol-phosphatase HisJ [Halalkalibacterium ligniniphilum]
MITYDGHVHTPFCPHGSKDTLQAYCDYALELGMKGLTFAEHAPLPKSFIDPTPEKDSGMSWERLHDYFLAVKEVKRQYEGRLTISMGLEIDYIEGYENETKAFLNEIGPELDDSILSVHFLRHQNKYVCLDYSPESFAELSQLYGSTDKVYENYYETLTKSILSDLGPYKPKRIGHMTLVNKFQKKFPASLSERQKLRDFKILSYVKEQGLSLDYNGAGLAKPYCNETYPPKAVAEEAAKRGIPLIYGSDAHTAKGLMTGFDQLSQNVSLSSPV